MTLDRVLQEEKQFGGEVSYLNLGANRNSFPPKEIFNASESYHIDIVSKLIRDSYKVDSEFWVQESDNSIPAIYMSWSRLRYSSGFDPKAKYEELEKMRRERGDKDGQQSVSGLYDLDPDSLFIQALAESPMKKGLVYHSIIGDQEQSDHPGGTDGVVPYSSSHLDNAASEVIVHSGHSIHRSPAARRELLRILRLHLRELEEK